MDRETQQSGDWIGRRPMHATNDGLSSPLAATFFAADRWRRWRGGWLDALGLGPRETPWRSVDVAAGVRLHCYDGAREPDAVPVLLVPAPIKQPYIWDLLPRISVVRRCLEAGLRVYLAAWPAPEPGQRDGGLAEYADQFLAACLRVIAAESRQPRPFLVGHSLGGTLAALFASLHPERVGGLVLLEAPLKFGRDAGAFAPLLAASPPAGTIVAALGGVPGSFLDAVAVAAAPERAFCGGPGATQWRALATPRRRWRIFWSDAGPWTRSPCPRGCSRRLRSNSTAPTPSPKGRCGSADAQPCRHVSRICRSRPWSIPRAGSSHPVPRWPCCPPPSSSTTPARPALASGMSASWSAGRRTLSCGRS